MNRDPFFDIEGDASSFLLPRRKWRELVFIGALKQQGDRYVRDPSRFMPPFDNPDLFMEGYEYEMKLEPDKKGEWVRVRRVRS